MRNASPHAAIDMPTSSDRPVGCASQQHEHAEHEPERDAQAREHADHVQRSDPSHRQRRPSGLPLADTARRRRQAALDGGQHLGDLDVEQAHALAAVQRRR